MIWKQLTRQIVTSFSTSAHMRFLVWFIKFNDENSQHSAERELTALSREFQGTASVIDLFQRFQGARAGGCDSTSATMWYWQKAVCALTITIDRTQKRCVRVVYVSITVWNAYHHLSSIPRTSSSLLHSPSTHHMKFHQAIITATAAPPFLSSLIHRAPRFPRSSPSR